MRFIPTRFHGILDYIVGPLLIASPWLLGFSEVEAATWAAVIAGALVLMQTVLTDFEVGLLKKVAVSTHLMMDAVVGVLLAISPWVLGFSDRVYLPHLIFGVYLFLAALSTHRVPSQSYQRAASQPS